MGLKGINAFEQHVEKIVVGVSGAALLVVLATQFMGSSSMVKVGKGAPVPPADAYKPVEQEAQRVAASLESGEPALPEAPKTAVLDTFKTKISTGVAPKPTLTQLGTVTPVTQLALGQESAADKPLAAVSVPATSEPVVHAFRSTISPFEWSTVEELKSYLPKQQPFDKAAVSVEAVFDGAALKKVLASDPDEDGPIQPMPLSWWRDGVEIVGVELEREQLGPDGNWSGSTIVKGMPGRPNMIAEVQDQLKAIGDVNLFLGRVRTVAEQVQRPSYYETIAGPAWVSPQEAAVAGETVEGPAAGSPERMVTDLADLDRKIADIEARIAPLPKNPPPRAPRPQGGGQSSGGGDGRGRGGGGGDAPSSSRQGGAEQQRLRDYNKYLALNSQLKTLMSRRDMLTGKLAAQGLAPDGAKLAVAADPQKQTEAKPMLDDPAVKVWAHDITVEPGATYRYRTRVVVNNPMFGRKDYLLPEQQDLALSQLARGEWSVWGEPVSVDSNGYFFMVSASEQDAVAGKRATAELYQFYYGYWRRGAVNVEPGDMLIAEAKLPTELPIYDLSKLASLPAQPEQQRVVERSGDEGEEGGGRRGVAPGVESGGRGGRGAPPPERPAQPEAAAPPAGVAFGPAKMAVGVDALFMDVAPVPSASDRRLASGQQLQTYLRDGAGHIITRIPDNERATAVYQRVSQSAKAGETQGRPVAKPVERQDVPPPPSRGRGDQGPGRGTAPPPTGGGGGGG